MTYNYSKMLFYLSRYVFKPYILLIEILYVKNELS